jgi:hypothetical protein
MRVPSIRKRASRAASGVAVLAVLIGACGDNLSHLPNRTKATGPSVQPLTCVPNLDGKIDSNELAAAFGVPVHYVVSPPGTSRQVNLAGTTTKSGMAWELASDYADDQSLVVEASSVTGKWYAASFPADAFVTPFDAGDQIESVGEINATGFLLLGLASHDMAPAQGKTLLIYSTPIQLLKFPVVVGQSFVSTGNIVNGTTRGLPYAGQDTYEVSVDAIGSLDLPSLTFDQVHRVRTKVTVTPAVGAPTTELQTSFFAECFGEVARATSAAGETNPNFTEAAELRRLGF